MANRSIGVILLCIFLIVDGVINLIHGWPSLIAILYLIEIAAGVLIFLGK